MSQKPIITNIIRDVAELPDRSSPADWPEAMLVTHAELEQILRKRLDEAADNLVKDLGRVIHDMTVANQAAVIEWQHGKGAEAGMQWIANGLIGPGLLPDPDAPHGKNAQKWYSANCADPFPACAICGEPSHILNAGNGYCSSEHADLNKKGAHE